MKGLEKVPARFPRSSPLARDIWNRNFVVTAIVPRRGGDDPPVAEPFGIRFWFSGARDHGVSWVARCNSSSGDVHITARRIEFKRGVSTAIGCPPGPAREDAWLGRFLTSNPQWRLVGEKLSLESDRATIELKGFAESTKCHVVPHGGWVDVGNSGYDCTGALRLLALEEIGNDGHMKGWTCQEREGEGARIGTVCRQRSRWLAFGGFDPMSLRR